MMSSFFNSFLAFSSEDNFKPDSVICQSVSCVISQFTTLIISCRVALVLCDYTFLLSRQLSFADCIFYCHIKRAAVPERKGTLEFQIALTALDNLEEKRYSFLSLFAEIFSAGENHRNCRRLKRQCMQMFYGLMKADYFHERMCS